MNILAELFNKISDEFHKALAGRMQQLMHAIKFLTDNKKT